MPTIESSYVVKASLQAVAEFHHSTQVLRQLTPPPVIVQIHRAEPLAEGSQSEFTMWFGPIPVRWLAVHSQVDPLSGFTDTQARGLLKRWVHTHGWAAEGENLTRLTDRVVYEHSDGWRGLLSRLLFAPPLLRLMFFYRRLVIRKALESS